MNTLNGNFIEKSIPNTKNATLSVSIGGVDATMTISDLKTNVLNPFTSLQVLDTVLGSNGITVTNLSSNANAGSQLLMANDTGYSAQWYSGSSNSGYGSNVLFLRQIKNAPFRFISDSANSFYFGASLYGSSPYLTIDITATNISAGLTVGGGGTLALDPSAIFQVVSTNKGMLIPKMAQSQINAIASPANGLIVYNTDLLVPCFYDGTGWRKISHTTM